METHASIIFQIVDRLRRRPLLAPEVRILVNGQPVRPLYKSGGYFIFTDMPAGEASFEIVSPVFQKEVISAAIPEAGNGYILRHLLMNPSEAYPFESSVATISGRMLEKKNPLAGRQFHVIPGDGGEVMKIAEDKAEAGNCHIKLFITVPERQLYFPGLYIIKDREEAKREVCLITGRGDQEGSFTLEKGMKYSHARGTSLVGVIECTTTADGKFFTALQDLKAGKANLDFLIRTEGGRSIKRTVEIETNRRNNLTDIEI